MRPFLSYLLLLLLSLCLVGIALVIPNHQDGKSKRVFENALSDEEHYNNGDEHNVDYDHEAFLGEAGAKSFDELTPEESKERLGRIVERIDTDKDGFVTLPELRDWIQFTQRRYVVEDAERQWNGLNTENDTVISWILFKKLTYGFINGETNEATFEYKDMMDRDYRRWKKADRNSDGHLSKEEFTDFIHPEEADHMKDIVVIETMEDIDSNKDGKVSLDEYIGDMYGNAETDEEPEWLENEKKQFSQYRDKNKDGFMDFEEVKSWILPDDYDNSEAEAKHLIYESDVNRDNQLSKQEILDKHDLFVGSQATDYGEALVRHDEF